MCPTLVAADCPLENELVDLEEESLVVGIGVGRVGPVYAGENGVANSDQLGGSNRVGCQLYS